MALMLRVQRPPQRGFTLVELVLVLLLVGVLSAVAVPRMTQVQGWRLDAYAETLRAELSDVQRRAIQQRRTYTVRFTADGALVTDEQNRMLANLACPSAQPGCLTVPADAVVTFNAAHDGSTRLGVPDGVLRIAIGAAGDGLALEVSAETGRVSRVP